MYDYIIIGGSIAGSSFARNISEDSKCLIIDRRDIFSNNLVDYKPCGGLLNPECQMELYVQKVPITDDYLINPQTTFVRNIDFDLKTNKDFSRTYYNIDRQKFEQYLLNIALERSNITHVKSLVRNFKKIDDYYEVTTTDETYKTKKIIVASGHNNKFNEKGNYDNKYVVVQAWYENEGVDTNYAIFDNNISDYYGWVVPKGDKVLIGIAFDKSDNKKYNELFDDLVLRINKKKNFNLNKLIHREGCQLIRPKTTSQVNMGNNDVIAIGEAANLISPSSAEGYSYALKSGRLVAEQLNENNLDLKSLDKYFKKNIRKKIMKQKIMYNKFLRSLIYKTKYIQINFSK